MPRRAGVSAFGISGTNAHVILEDVLPSDEKPFQEASSYLLPLSAKTPEALATLAKSYQQWLLSTDEPLHSIAYTASVRRTHWEHRLCVVGENKGEMAAILGAFAQGECPAGVVVGKTIPSAPKVVFVFPGQGSQWVGMGRQLYRDEPVFRGALDACDQAIR
jgi:acyl transferase domain-containing protein